MSQKEKHSQKSDDIPCQNCISTLNTHSPTEEQKLARHKWALTFSWYQLSFALQISIEPSDL